MTHFQTRNVTTGRPETLGFADKVATLFQGVSIARPVSTISPDDGGLPYERRTIAGEDGITLGSWYIPGNDDVLVILFHGYTSEKSSLLAEASAFHELGCSGLLVDFRGMGESSDSVVSIGYLEADDVVSAVRYATRTLPHHKLLLYGQSMGAAAIMRAIAIGQVHPDGIILEGVFDTMLNAVKNRFRLMGVPSFPAAQLLVYWGGREFGFDGFSHDPVTYASSVTCPTLMLHGSADPRALAEQARRVFATIDAPKTFELFEGAAHEPLEEFAPDRWTRVVTTFLNGIAGD